MTIGAGHGRPTTGQRRIASDGEEVRRMAHLSGTAACAGVTRRRRAFAPAGWAGRRSAQRWVSSQASGGARSGGCRDDRRAGLANAACLDRLRRAERGCCRSRAAGQPDLPARPSSGRGRRRSRCAPSATARDPRRHRQPPHPSAHPGSRSGRRDAAGRDAGLTPRPERSVGGSGRTDRHRQPARTARSTAPATPADDPAAAPDALLTIEEVIAQLRVSRAAFYRWRRRGTGPAEVRLPGGGVRIRRSAFQAWLRRLEHTQQEDTPA
jgi:excisionase family DNA binding protein